MSIRTVLIGAAMLASAALPGAASAQRYGYGDGYYGAPSRYHGYDRGYERDRRWAERQERRRWREIERRRRWEWRHRYRGGYGGDYYRY